MSASQLHDTLASMLPKADRPYVALLSDCLFTAVDGAADVLAVGAVVEAAMWPTVLRRLMRALLRHHFTRQPDTLLLVEDAHWLDTQSWQLLSEIAKAEPSVRLLLTSRPLDSAGNDASTSPSPQSVLGLYKAVCGSERSHHVLLAGVDEATACELAAQQLQCAGLHPSLSATIHLKSDGIPLFIQHLCVYLQQHSLVDIHPVTRVASLATSSSQRIDDVLPSSLEGLLASVLDRLPADCQLALKTAAVVGRHFVLSLVHAAHPMEVTRDAMQAMMEAAVEMSVTVEEDTSVEWAAHVSGEQHESAVQSAEESELYYRFTHQLLRDAAYFGLLYQQRRELHGRLADHLASLHTHGSPSSHTVRSSVHLLAHHYWLALCNADDVLIEQPDQRLLQAATYYLLEAASHSLNYSAVDAGALFLHRAARCVQLVAAVERREYWELRWLCALMSVDAFMFTPPALKKLATLWGPSEPQDGFVYVAGTGSRKVLAQRMIALLDTPSASADLPPMRAHHYRFNAMLSLWLAAWPRRDEALRVTRALEVFTQSVEGSEAPYYQTEMFVATGSAFFILNLFADLQRLFSNLERHDFFNAAVKGRVKLTKYAQGANPIPHLAMMQATYRWLQGRVVSCWETHEDVMRLIAATAHPPSIIRGWLALLKMAMVAGQCPQSVAVIEAGIPTLPAVDSVETHLTFLMRRCILLSLQVWRHSDACPPQSLVAPTSPCCGTPYCDDLLGLIEQLILDGAVFGVMFHYIHQAFPSVIDFRPEMSFSIHEAMVRLMKRYELLFAHNPRSIELARMEAALLIRRLQAELGDEETQEAEAAEAERLLTKAMGLVGYEKTPALKVCMTWTELRVWQGRWGKAEAELQAALDDLPEADDTGSYWVTAAQRMLDEVRRGRKGQGASNGHSFLGTSSSTAG